VSRRKLCCILLLVAVSALVGGAAETRAEGSVPTVTLLAPANGSTVVNAAGTEYPTFRWQISWEGAPPMTMVYSLEYATDPGFADAQTMTNFSCRTDALASCQTSIRPQQDWARHSGSWYWRIRVIAPVQLTTGAWSFRAVRPADRDRDGVPDSDDNCPAKANPRQDDYERDGKGDACQPDRTAPRVRALPGTGRRGLTAFFDVRSKDNRGYVRLRLVVLYKGRTLLHGNSPFIVRNWGKETFHSVRPIPRALPAGTYRFCATAWDKRGNRARSCAPYRFL
jgi:Thrombospondin type 3 repeat